MLTKDQIFAADDIKTVDVDVPEWGGTVRVATMSAAARDEYEQMLYRSRDGDDIRNIRASLVASCVVDDKGERVFSKADIDRLGRKSGAAISRVFDAAQRINALDDAALEDAKGNSDADPSGDSTTD